MSNKLYAILILSSSDINNNVNISILRYLEANKNSLINVTKGFFNNI